MPASKEMSIAAEKLQSQAESVIINLWSQISTELSKVLNIPTLLCY